MSTEWVVVTGAPSSGISSVIKSLEDMHFPVVHEMAREVISEGLTQGLSLSEIRSDEVAFQKKVFDRKFELESTINPCVLRFWDRALPDSVVYIQQNGGDASAELSKCLRGVYKQVFFMDPLGWHDDGVRNENPALREALGLGLQKIYADLGYKIICVPATLDVEQRKNLLLKCLFY